MLQWVIFVVVIVISIYRFISKQKKAMEEAERRRQQAPPNNPTTTASTPPSSVEDQPRPKTIDEILKEMHRRVETQNKPYARPVIQKTTPQRQVLKKEVVKAQPKVHEKKEPTPFLTEEYAAYNIAPAKIPANMAEDFIKQGQLADIYDQPLKKPGVLKTFILRDAVVASIILNRPEW